MLCPRQHAADLQHAWFMASASSQHPLCMFAYRGIINTLWQGITSLLGFLLQVILKHLKNALLLNFSPFRSCFRQSSHFQVRTDRPALHPEHLVEEEHLTLSQTGIFSTPESISSAFPLYSAVSLFPAGALIHNCWGAADEGSPCPLQRSLSPVPDMAVMSL